MNAPGQNLARPIPTFTRSYLKSVLQKYDFKMRCAKTLEPVCTWIIYLIIKHHIYNILGASIIKRDSRAMDAETGRPYKKK